MAKEILYRGKTVEELKSLSLNEFADLLPSRQRRSLLRGFDDQKKKLLEKMKTDDPNVKTHCRDIVILPIMIGKVVKVYNGKDFVTVRISEDMVGHFLGEFAMTRKKVSHHAPGIGATRSSASLSVK